MVNVLPLDDGETITTVMALPEDEDSWASLFVMFATASGGVRRNRLSDFTNVMANGKIAMKLADGDHLVGARVFEEADNVFLATRQGKCVRFPVTDVRVFSGRTSQGVRGINLADGDEVIAMSGLKHVETEVSVRDEYLRAVNAGRRLAGGDYTDREDDKARDEELAGALEHPEFTEMALEEEFILTVTADGMGKRTSAYDYRISKRGGKGIDSIDLKRGEGTLTEVVATLPVLPTDELVMVSDGGQLIRLPIDGISFTGRTARGVTLFRVSGDEKVVSISRIRDVDGVGEAVESAVVDADQAEFPEKVTAKEAIEDATIKD